MSTPLKPWESNYASLQGVNINTSGLGPYTGRNVLSSNAPHLPSQPVGSVRAGGLPPLPQRPPHLCTSTTNRYGGYAFTPNVFSNSYSGYGGYPNNMYGSYPGGYGYGSYGFSNGGAFENSRFLQAAEENSRNAFQSIESLVRAFTSVSMMLESTYYAMYSSFRAVLGVVDNFSRLRQLFAQFISAITILRIIKNFYYRLLYWLGILDRVEHSPQPDKIWDSVTSGASGSSSNNQVACYSSWPLFTFIALLFGGPYLISKFISPYNEPKKWDPKKGTFHKAAYPHKAASEAELSFRENEILNIAPSDMQLQDNSGWLLAANQRGDVGYIPVTRLGQSLRLNISSYQENVSNDGEATEQ